MKDKKINSKYLNTFLISFAFTLYIIFFVSSEIYFNNTNEFSFSIIEIYPYLLIQSALAALIFSLFIGYIGEKYFKLVISVLVALLFMSWIEGNLLYRDYGLLDGRQINWNSWKWWGYIDLSIWAIMIIVLVYMKENVYRLIKQISIIAIVIICITFSVKYLNINNDQDDEYVFDESVMGEFSKDKNVIVIMLDEIQSDVFYEIIEEDNYYKNIFDDFVYYPDSVTVFPWTVPSIPAMLTGEYYDNSEPFDKYVKKAYSENSLLKNLIDSNYKVDIFPNFYDFIYPKSIELSSNLIRKGALISAGSAIAYGAHLIELSLFKISPHIMRKYIYNNNQFLFSHIYNLNEKKIKHMDWKSKDRDMIKDIISNTSMVDDDHIFKFIHFKAGHTPWSTDENGIHIKPNDSRTNYESYVKYKLKLVNELFNYLKNLNIYDKSFIYIISDHGAGRSMKTKLNTEVLRENIPSTENYHIHYQIKARAISLFLKKLQYNKGKLNITKEHFYNGDLRSTILEDVGLSGPKPATDPRRYFYFVWEKRTKYLPPLFEFLISGNSWLDSSWYGPINVYTKQGKFERVMSYQSQKKIFNKLSANSGEKEIQYIKKNDTEYDFIFEPEEITDFLLSVGLNYMHQIGRFAVDIYINKIKLDRISSRDVFLNKNNPYYSVLIKKNYLNKNKNVILLSFDKKPVSDFKDLIDSVYLFELTH